ncbi:MULTISPECIES: GntR family transcriptional regulator [Bacillus cereus group]|uniref:GntR family transcriptional regulator n=1 Tax=Bacillus cereus group TaxID=86661 RepID=UPI00030262E1|nr:MULTISPECIES: GntR family transcriptional regulator [Bacillus cereus group]MCU4733615.1 GntR family transcriptional regulator [Bacillus cereus]MCU5149233.1 GntR family transcriptional regulator [Bacillus cereus]MCU5496169.1 GntR family transcriptional regulator [Bacillus cereus]MCU5639332.1 GntR family transcriptional regulator [Bacillus cereus]MCU5702515.1 GntR family transcriptional regulator [Bacillus cereus]
MRIFISNSLKVPIYQQIINQIKQQILSGELKEEESLPSIRHLARDLQVSVITSKRAYEELEKEGYIYSQVGKGSFVATQDKERIQKYGSNALHEKLIDVIRESQKENLTIEELETMLRALYKEVN